MEKMKRIKNRIIMLVMIMMTILSVNTYCAEGLNEVDVEYVDINKTYEGFMKNFIVELRQMQVSLYDEKGQLVWKYNVLPKEFEGNSEITRVFGHDGHSVEETTTTYKGTGGDGFDNDREKEHTSTHTEETWIFTITYIRAINYLL